MSALAPQPGPPQPPAAPGSEGPGEAILSQMLQLAQHFIQSADDPQDKEGMTHILQALVALAQLEKQEPAAPQALAPQGLHPAFSGALQGRGMIGPH